MNEILVTDYVHQDQLTKIVTIENEHLKVVLSSYGAGIYQMSYKKNGEWIDTLLTPVHFEDYLVSKSYYGKTIGRTAGRIFSKPFQINQKTFQLTPDPGKNNMLHGGSAGLSFQNFDLFEINNAKEQISVVFRNVTNDEIHGIPGNLSLDVKYTLVDNRLIISYDGVSDADTVCNLTNHAYFNLEKKKISILDHMLQVHSDDYIDVDDDFGYAGEKSVQDTPFDFRKLHLIKDYFHQVKDSAYRGYDHVWQVNQHLHATLISKQSHIGLNVYSDTPSIVIYTHNYQSAHPLDDQSLTGVHQAITFECQKEAGCLFYKGRASLILKKGEHYAHQIIYEYFSI